MTKVDAADRSGLARLRRRSALLNPAALSHGVGPWQRGRHAALPPARAEDLPDLSGAPAKPPIFPVRIALGGDVDWTAFTVWLSALLHARGDDVMRVKGVVRTPAGRLLLQSVRKMVQRPEILPEQQEREDDTIVVIGRGYDERDLGDRWTISSSKRPG